MKVTEEFFAPDPPGVFDEKEKLWKYTCEKSKTWSPPLPGSAASPSIGKKQPTCPELTPPDGPVSGGLTDRRSCEDLRFYHSTTITTRITATTAETRATAKARKTTTVTAKTETATITTTSTTISTLTKITTTTTTTTTLLDAKPSTGRERVRQRQRETHRETETKRRRQRENGQQEMFSGKNQSAKSFPC